MVNTSTLPPPPIFKPTIIQMKGNNNINANNNNNNNNLQNSSILTTSTSPELLAVNNQITRQNASASSSPILNSISKKRRRSSQAFDSEEMAKKRKELKIAHSIIEKKRRIKMNREFEALKYLVPACRTSILQSLTTQPTNNQQQQQSPMVRNNSITSEYGSEFGGQMHKLTILQSTVEYISYLHHIIQLQKNIIVNTADPNWEDQNDLIFTNFELNLDQVRDIENEFDFQKLFKDLILNNGQPLKFKEINKDLKIFQNGNVDDNKEEVDEVDVDDELRSLSRSSSSCSNTQLPSPLVTPNIISDSITSNLKKYKITTSDNIPSSTTSTSSYNDSSKSDSAEFQLPLPMISAKKKSYTLVNSSQQQQQQQQQPDLVLNRENELSKVLLSIKDQRAKRGSISNLLN